MVNLSSQASVVRGRAKTLAKFPVEGYVIDDVGPNPEAVLTSMVQVIFDLRPNLRNAQAHDLLRAQFMAYESKLQQPAPAIAADRGPNVMRMLEVLVAMYNELRPPVSPVASLWLVSPDVDKVPSMYPGSMVAISFSSWPNVQDQ